MDAPVRRPASRAPVWPAAEGLLDAVEGSAVGSVGERAEGSGTVATAGGARSAGRLRIIALARTVGGQGAPAEADRAVAIALNTAEALIEASDGSLDTTQRGLARRILARWRSGLTADRPDRAPGGTDLVIALAGRRGVRVIAFGASAAAVLAGDHVVLLPPAPILADPAGPMATRGLDHPEAAAAVRTLAVTPGAGPSLVWLSSEPRAEWARESDWTEALLEVADRLHREEVRDEPGADTPEPGADTREPGAKGANAVAGAADAVAGAADAVAGATESVTDARALPDWLGEAVAYRLGTVGRVALTWRPDSAAATGVPDATAAASASRLTAPLVSAGAPSRSQSSGARQVPPTPWDGTRDPHLGRGERDADPRTRWLWALVTGLLAACVVVGAWLVSMDRTPSPTPASTPHATATSTSPAPTTTPSESSSPTQTSPTPTPTTNPIPTVKPPSTTIPPAPPPPVETTAPVQPPEPEPSTPDTPSSTVPTSSAPTDPSDPAEDPP